MSRAEVGRWAGHPHPDGYPQTAHDPGTGSLSPTRDLGGIVAGQRRLTGSADRNVSLNLLTDFGNVLHTHQRASVTFSQFRAAPCRSGFDPAAHHHLRRWPPLDVGQYAGEALPSAPSGRTTPVHVPIHPHRPFPGHREHPSPGVLMTYRSEPATTGPRRRRTLRALLAVPAVSAGSAASWSPCTPTANAATTLDASAADRGRHLGQPNRCTPRRSVRSMVEPTLGRPPGSPPPAARPVTARRNGAGNRLGITVGRTGTHTTPTATGSVG